MSYILIDRNQMKITHKHPDRVVLSKLSWIECTNAGAVMSLSGIRPLMDFTPLELQTLYKNATGAELKAYANNLAQAVLDAAKRMPDTVAKLEEVVAQAACILDGDKSSFKYAPGQMKPFSCPGLFEADAITVPRLEAEELRAAQGYSAPAFGATTHYSPPANGVATPAAPRAPSAPKAGGVREVIYAAADAAWAAAGNTKSLPAILAMRKKIMDELEVSHSIKRTTCSTALGDWQKMRVV